MLAGRGRVRREEADWIEVVQHLLRAGFRVKVSGFGVGVKGLGLRVEG